MCGLVDVVWAGTTGRDDVTAYMGDQVEDPDIGLALPGGGYRAAAFHLGVLRKLHDLGLLANVRVISSVSGGSSIARPG